MTGWQKASYPLVGAVVLMALVPGFIAAGEARLELTVVVRGGAFVPSTIVLPGYGTVLNLTVRNEDATLAPAPTFTLTNGSALVVDLALDLGVNRTVEFTVLASNRIRIGATEDLVDGAGGVRFFSRNQPAIEGLIVVGIAPPDPDTMPVLYVRLNATTIDDKNVFEPDTIRIPQMPVRIHARIVNTDPHNSQHTFTFREGTTDHNYWVNETGDSIEVEFDILAAGRIRIGGAELDVETGKGGTQAFCLPHRGAGMYAYFVVGSAEEPEAVVENGVFLRAYWIGLVGIAATAVLLVAAFFVIKGGSRHYTDHSEHARRGLP